jgi:peptidoglycan/xylan/chitin deacetylase (PgdA/CDA1 family)
MITPEKRIKEDSMRTRVRIYVSACFYYSGLIDLIHWWMRRTKQHLLILNYHDATEGDLRRHLLYLRRHYRIEHLEDALEELYLGRKREGRDQRLPLVLTFDDGYHDNYTHCLPLARELGVPMTIFLIPGYIENGHRFWWDEAESICRFTDLKEVVFEGNTYHLDQPDERVTLIQLIDMRARYAPSVVEREAFLSNIRAALAVGTAYAEEKATLPLTWEEAREMDASGWISFGAHTMHHPILGYLVDGCEVMREVTDCRSLLEKQLGHPVHTFAYPVGKPEHIGVYGPIAVAQAGYKWVVTTTGGVNTTQTNPHMLRRYEVNLSDHWLVMAAKTTGLLGFIVRLRRLVKARLTGWGTHKHSLAQV